MFELNQLARGREYLKESPSCEGKNSAGTPLYSCAVPSGISPPSRPAFVVRSSTSIPCCINARHIGMIAVAGPPSRPATDGITCNTRMFVLAAPQPPRVEAMTGGGHGGPPLQCHLIDLTPLGEDVERPGP